MREYQPIWERVKTKNSASIVAPVELHKRIIKAVCKEKYMDEEYKRSLADRSLRAEIIITRDLLEENKLHFSLDIKFHPKLAKVDNL